MNQIWIAITTFSLFIPSVLPAQPYGSSSKELPVDQVAAIITPAAKKEFAIHFPIWKVYEYSDRSGKYYCVLTEKFDSVGKDSGGSPDTLHYAIRAIDLKEDSGRLKKIWEINDYAMRDPGSEGIERSIWFWTKYVEFTDFDDDGLIEPIIVYGSHSDSDLSSGRIKFIIYFKGKKIGIRHQDSDLDEGRATHTDKDFYSLPAKLKTAVKGKMEAINKAGQGIFESKDLSF